MHLDRRRGLVNFGVSVFKTLYGTANIADIQHLHDTLNALQLQNSDITDSLPNQLTCVKKLSRTTEVNAVVIANLSSVVKDNIVQSHDIFRKITRDLMWLNVTVYTLSELFTTISQLEFA